jgi:Ribbon-helix-helix protein, copG family
MHLLARFSRAHDALFGLLENGALMVAFHIDEHLSSLRKLHQKYRDRPMSLADACIVRMAEIYERHAVLTLDSEFLSLSQTWPSSAHAYSPGGGVDDRGHQLRARRVWARKLKAVRNGRAIYDMGCRMKITLNIDDTVMAELKHEAARQGRTMSELVETALRLLLSSQRKRGKSRVTKVPQRRGARRCCRPRCPVSTRPWKVLVLEVVRAHRLPSGTRCCGLQRSVLPIQAR